LINVGIASRTWLVSPLVLANWRTHRVSWSAGVLLPDRPALEQIKADVAYSNRNVKLCGMVRGMAYGELGPTHHSD
jgi:transketolase